MALCAQRNYLWCILHALCENSASSGSCKLVPVRCCAMPPKVKVWTSRVRASSVSTCRTASSVDSGDPEVTENDGDLEYQVQPTVVEEAFDDQPDYQTSRLRENKRDWDQKPDVGTLGVMLGNWGNRRSSKALRTHVQEDIKRSPAQIIMLQEASRDVEDRLANPAVAANPNASSAVAMRGGGSYWTVFGCEPDDDDADEWPQNWETETSLLIAARKSICSGIQPLVWKLMMDGEYKDADKKRQGFTRVLAAHLHFNQPFHGMMGMSVMNVHLHFMTAKKGPGFNRAWVAFWPMLAQLIKTRDVRIIGGDWNMSLFEVVPQLQKHGVYLQLAAWTPFERPHRETKELMIHIDSCAIFVRGCHSVTRSLTDYKTCALQPAVAEANWPAVAEEDPDGSEQLFPAIQWIPNGLGYPVTSYRPKFTGARQEAYIGSSFDDLLTDEEAECRLPECKQKRLRVSMFDPDGRLGQGGAHCPVMIFLGKRSHRSAEGLEKRLSRWLSYQHAQAQREKGHVKGARGDGAVTGKGTGSSSSTGPSRLSQLRPGWDEGWSPQQWTRYNQQWQNGRW
jgi:hypothetical protein